MDEIINEAFAANYQVLLWHLERLTRNSATAEDMAQEAFVRLAREVIAGRTPDNIRAWLFQVARNLMVSDARRRQTAERHADRLVEPATIGSAEDEILRAEQRAELAEMLASLDPIDRKSLVMAAVGYNSAEIARTVGRTEGAVRTRLCRARGRLRTALLAASTG